MVVGKQSRKKKYIEYLTIEQVIGKYSIIFPMVIIIFVFVNVD